MGEEQNKRDDVVPLVICHEYVCLKEAKGIWCFLWVSVIKRLEMLTGFWFTGSSIPISQWCLLHILPYFHKIYKFIPQFPENLFFPHISTEFVHFPLCFCKIYKFSPYLHSIYVFLLNLHFWRPLFWPWCTYTYWITLLICGLVELFIWWVVPWSLWSVLCLNGTKPSKWYALLFESITLSPHHTT